jgi:hypothetical protein
MQHGIDPLEVHDALLWGRWVARLAPRDLLAALA